ncbi:calcium-binding protein [Gammaproteobacteria bacterium]|nr:calcium-binding protein [Gammaproteobacteria bacterium]
MAFITAETRSSIVELAMGMLNQAPSTTLLSTLIEKSTSGSSTQDLADYIATTDAFTAEYPATQTAREFATEMFGKLITGGTLDADINTAVIDLLEGLLIAGTTKAQGFVAVIEFLANPANADHADLGDIAQSFQNRADAAEYFVVTKELGGSTDAELAAAIASVTSDAATLTAANTAADATASAEEVVAGQTFTLTTGLDTKTGGAGDDTVSALPTTLTVGDTFDGGAGSDTVSLTSSLAANTAVAGFTLKNIENLAVNITDADTGTAESLTLNLAGTDSEKVTLSGLGATTANDTLVLNNVAAGTTIAMNSATDLNVTANFVAAATTGTTAAGTPNSVSVEVAGVSRTAATDNTLTIGSGFEIMNLAAKTAASRLDQITFGGDTLNITGDANLTIDTDLDAAIYLVNASGYSGKLSIDTSNNAAPDVAVGGVDIHDATVIGGSGNDTLDLSQNASDNEISVSAGAGDDTVTIGAAITKSSTTNAGDQLDGGDGKDTLVYTSAGFAALTAANTVGVSNFEVAALSNALADTITVAKIQATGIDTVVIPGGTGALVMAAGAVTVGISSSLTGALTVTDTGSAVTDSLTIANTKTTADDMGDGNNLTIAGYETVNIVTTAVSDTSQDFGTITLTGDDDEDGDPVATALNFSGADRASVGAITATTINASGMTAASTGTTFNMTVAATSVTTITGSAGADTLRGDAKSTINGGGGNDTIVGGSGNDTLNGDAGKDTITTGAGADTVNGGADNDTIVIAGSLTAADKIDGGDGTDTLSVTNASITALQGLSISDANTFNANFNSVETLYVSDALDSTGDDFDLGYLDGIETVTLTTVNGAQTIDGFDSGNTLILTTTPSANVTAKVNGATTSATDVLNIALTANADDDYDALVLGNIETVNISVTQATASATSQTATVGLSISQTAVASGGTGAAQTVNFVGSEDIVVDTAIAAGTISAAGMSARLASTPGLVMSTLATATTAMPGQTVTGSSGADTLYGSTGADTITGGAGNDTLVGGKGADTIDGTSGSDTLSTEGMVGASIGGTGTGTSTGVVVNLSSSALTNVAVLNAIAQNVSGAVTSVPAGSTAYVFNDTLNTNSTAADTLLNIDNVTLAGNGINYVVGSDTANTVTLGSGNDTVSTGKGDDTIVGIGGNNTLNSGAGDDTFTITAAGSLDTNDVITGGSGTDVINLTNVAAATAVLDDQSGIETVTIVDGAAGADSQLSITYTAANTTSITVDASALDAGEDFTLVVSDAQVTGTTTFKLGGGADVLTNGAGSEVIVFGSTAAASGTVTASDFTPAADKDVLDFTAFLTGGDGTVTEIAATATADASIDNKVILLVDADGATSTDETGEIAALIQGTGDAMALASGGKAVIISGHDLDAGDDAVIFFVDDTLGATAGTIEADDVTIVGTLTTFDLDAMVDANILSGS